MFAKQAGGATPLGPPSEKRSADIRFFDAICPWIAISRLELSVIFCRRRNS